MKTVRSIKVMCNVYVFVDRQAYGMYVCLGTLSVRDAQIRPEIFTVSRKRRCGSVRIFAQSVHAMGQVVHVGVKCTEKFVYYEVNNTIQ
jgi:hypothetical protein